MKVSWVRSECVLFVDGEMCLYTWPLATICVSKRDRVLANFFFLHIFMFFFLRCDLLLLPCEVVLFALSVANDSSSSVLYDDTMKVCTMESTTHVTFVGGYSTTAMTCVIEQY